METRAKPNISTDQRIVLNSKRFNMLVTPFEAKMIKIIREVKYGNIDIIMHNGIPTKYDVRDSHHVDPTQDQDILELILESEK